MKKRTLAFLLAFVMLLSLLPVSALAEDGVTDVTATNEAKIVDKEFATLDAAITEAEDGDTVTLLKNVMITQQVTINKGITLDGDGYSITAENDSWSAESQTKSLLLITADGAALENVVLDSNEQACGVQVYCADGVKLNDVTLSNSKKAPLTINASAVTATGTLTIDGNNAWGNGINVGWGSNISDIDSCVFDASNATLDGVDMVYTDASDKEHAGEKEFVITLPDEWVEVASDTLSALYIQKSAAVAQIGETYYVTLGGAIEDVPDETATTVTLLNDTKENITIPADKTITLDLNGNTLTNVNSDTIRIEFGGKLTVTGSGTVDNVSNGKAAIFNNGTVVLDGGEYTRSAETGEVSSGRNSYYNILNHGVMTVNDGVEVTQAGNFSSLFANGYYSYKDSTNERSGYVEGTNNPEPELTINGGTFSGGLNTIKNDDGATLTIEDGLFQNVTQNVIQNHNVVTINGGTFDGGDLAAGQNIRAVVYNCGCGADVDLGKLDINGGTYFGGDAGTYVVCDVSSESGSYTKITDGNFNAGSAILAGKVETADIEISGGYFTSDPSKYVAEGYAALESDDMDYTYMVDKKGETPAEVVPANPTADTNLPSDATEEDEKLAGELEEVLKSNDTKPSISSEVVAAAANTVANNNNTTAAEGKAALENENITVGDNDTVTIVVQPYMDIKITDVDAETSILTLDITPMYNKVATTDKEDIQIGSNAVVIESAQPLSIAKPVTVTIPLPETFSADSDVKVGHKGYVYDGRIDENHVLTFTNPHGFSEFVIGVTPVAQIDAQQYSSLQAAVDAVGNGETIQVLVANQTATVSRTVKFTVSGEDCTITLGANCTDKDDDANVFDVVYSKPSPGGGSSKPSVNPDPEEPEETELPFTDVVGHWAEDAVKYVYENKLMDGVSSTEFAPEMNTTRGMVVTILYRLENSPAVSGSCPFTDVTPGFYYEDAIIWGEANGIVEGMGDGTFAPDAEITREQLAAALYRYAQFKGYDVSVGEDTNILSYDDADELSSWAVPAMQWACGSGLVEGSGSELNPTAAALRSHLATILMRFCEDIAK
ncbi:MAG: S-layer homology domain-containing protein [Candidatus Heteroscillospira sp.]